DAGPRGEFVTFFGRPASTYKSLALLSLRHDAVILVLGAARVGPRIDYRVYLEDVIDPGEYADRPDAVRAITQRFTAGLEAMARRHPEQYFWLHRRWKHRPKERRQAA
ncbi:MAG: lysophospholipid acyltransferase family protein, partial [Gemmataceae bacterium]